MRNIAVILAVLVICACNGAQNENTVPKMPEKARVLYTKAENKICDLERRMNELDEDTDARTLLSLISDAKRIEYNFDPSRMNSVALEECSALKVKVEKVKRKAIAKAENLMKSASISVYEGSDMLLDSKTEYPVYLEKGDKLHFEVSLQKAVPVKFYNADTKVSLKTYNATSVRDSLLVANTGIYLLEINADAAQYASVSINYHTKNIDRIYNPKSVRSETVECTKGAFRAVPVKGVNLVRVFEQPRKFTLKGQFKAAFSGGGDVALVPVQVPAGATDLLYSMRIATSEKDRSSDGRFHDDLAYTYKRIKFLGLPMYEKTRTGGSGLISTLLDDNRPLREEDAYCNMYIFRNQSHAKQFQDGTKPASALNYDVDWSTIGTQSCNGRIPVNESKTIYLAFQNERVRYTNYLWVEVEAVVPHTVYYTTKYSIN